jgi:ribosomal protein S6
MLQKYELLAIFPGTLDETETAAAAEKVKELIEKSGAADVAFENMGKTRLAYPMNHIRYGYFRTYAFFAEPGMANSIQQKLNVSNLALRAIIHRHNPKSVARKLREIISDVAIQAERAEREEARKDEGREHAPHVLHTAPRPVHAPVAPVHTEAVQMEDIDKKLDELLEKDLTKV